MCPVYTGEELVEEASHFKEVIKVHVHLYYVLSSEFLMDDIIQSGICGGVILGEDRVAVGHLNKHGHLTEPLFSSLGKN